MKNFIWLAVGCVLFTVIVSCDPSDPVVGSPGAGVRWKFIKVSGDNQSTSYLDTLPNRLVVQLTDLLDVGIENREIGFSVVSGKGQVQKPSLESDVFEYIVPTDFDGFASAQFLNQISDTTVTSQVKATVIDSTQFFVVFTISTSP